MSQPARDAIQTRNLSKLYGAVTALSDVSLTVPMGSIYGFLGPNGAGKTTTIRLLLGFIQPSAGEAQLLGYNSWTEGVAARSRLGFLVAADALYPDLTGAALLAYTAALSGQRPALRAVLLDALELGPDALQRKFGTYSKGMRQKIALIAAMQHDPEVLVLDEPTDGLDPLIQRNFEETLQEIHRRGRTIFMSSHDLPEVERLCETVAIVRGGRLLTEARISDLQRRHRRQAIVQFRTTAPADLGCISGVVQSQVTETRADLLFEGEIGPLLHALAGYDVVDLLLPPAKLDDIFLGFYGADGVAGEPLSPPDSISVTAGRRA